MLSAVLGLPKEDLVDLEITNSELHREFREDKKGILDVRIQLRDGRQINVEIQILPTDPMPERALFVRPRHVSGRRSGHHRIGQGAGGRTARTDAVWAGERHVKIEQKPDIHPEGNRSSKENVSHGHDHDQLLVLLLHCPLPAQ
ncbi:conserved hypothetical protein (putative transposase or invertase) [Desulfonatronum thiosulfatophilum]|uniref:PD-(D/E)XK nuclease family transposase n=1 Tax=Desulfonatronum thiosulfatophilum TaxID=617002 RepID=A0A1G6CMQ4_9BACT|nr:conserved hypothetical protein (putative transposase or invertase) [Desulfonatronum thiosulfatophilum]